MAKKSKLSKLGDILKKFTKKSITKEIQKEKDSSYDIRKIFQEMELNLISSMKRAFYFHEREQQKEGFQWEQWQLTKLRELEKYRKRNKELVDSYNDPIQEAIDREIDGNYKKGQNRVKKFIKKAVDKTKELFFKDKAPSIDLPSDIEDEQSLKDYISKLLKRPIKPPEETNFFGINDKKLNALQETVTNDLKNANHAVLRKMDDIYRQVLYKAQVNMQAGAKTLNQAIDMATKDFLDKGISCIRYKDGKMVNITSYAEMALRTASHRATLLGEGKKRDEYGLYLVVVSAHANTCNKCLPWQGKVIIDDVFSHPSKEFIEENKQYPLLSEAIEKGLLHPNCRHTLTTYFPGITKLPVVPDEEEALKNYDAEQRQRALEREIRKWKRIKVGACDVENQEKATAKVRDLENRLRDHLKDNPQLRRDYDREKTDIRSIKQINSKPDLKEFNKYKEVLGEEAPRTLEDFKKLKYNNSEKWSFVKLDYHRRKKLIDDPSLKLPNADKVFIANEKFTKYLYNEANKKGYAKGKLFEDRLGYSVTNYEMLKNEIIKRAPQYPSVAKLTDEHGTRYEQKIIIYGLNDKPANVIVAWNVKDGVTKMTSTYIKEVK